MNKKNILINFVIVVGVVILGVIMLNNNNANEKNNKTPKPSDSKALEDKITGLFSQDFNITRERAAIDPGKIKQGCLGGKDCIPSIDNPKFESASEAEEWINNDDLIFGIEINGDIRAYPQKILNWHELVNDTVGGKPVLISFCPLCGTAIAFDRTVNGKIVQFGVSGKLVNSNLVMYNRDDNSLWQQQGGEQIVGDDLGKKLKKVPLTTARWKDWKNKNPNTKVLSRDTGFNRDYEVYPYGNYEKERTINFPVENRDDRLHEKAVIYGVELNGEAAAYSEDFLKQNPELSDSVGGQEIRVIREENGEVNITNAGTGEKIIPERGFWFSWAAFHPETKLNSQL